jgi:hypothetical protein
VHWSASAVLPAQAGTDSGLTMWIGLGHQVVAVVVVGRQLGQSNDDVPRCS